MKRNPASIAPSQLGDIQARTEAIGFQMTFDPEVGALLKTLVASKPAGHFLEIGTGTWAATAWILAGMDTDATIISVENDLSVMAWFKKCQFKVTLAAQNRPSTRRPGPLIAAASTLSGNA